MALTGNRQSIFSEREQDIRLTIDPSVTQIYDGAILSRNPAGTGQLLLGADSAGFRFAGIAFEEYPGFQPQSGTNTITVDDNKIHVSVPGSGRVFRLPIVSAVGDLVYVVDDESVDLIGGVTSNVLVGPITNIFDANTVEVRI
jgi:hypothetical protein